MIKTIEGNRAWFQSELLTNCSSLFHFFSTRKGEYDELELFSMHIGIPLSKIVVPQQTHSANIEIVDSFNINGAHANTDAFITREPGLCIAVKTADCTPVLLYDPIEKVIAAVHSGWRGTAQNIVGKTINKLEEVFQSKPENILAAIGPCISQENYEVGAEVIQQFKPLFPNNNSILNTSGLKNNKAKLSVRHAIFEQLVQKGLQPKHIDLFTLCTHSESNDFYSARRDGAKTGRMINGIMLK